MFRRDACGDTQVVSETEQPQEDSMTEPASLKEVRDYFGIDGKQMIAEWRKLSDRDKVELREGIGDGTLTY
jgi:hypothetical protein